jgi:hypothetical protein
MHSSTIMGPESVSPIPHQTISSMSVVQRTSWVYGCRHEPRADMCSHLMLQGSDTGPILRVSLPQGSSVAHKTTSSSGDQVAMDWCYHNFLITVHLSDSEPRLLQQTQNLISSEEISSSSEFESEDEAHHSIPM